MNIATIYRGYNSQADTQPTEIMFQYTISSLILCICVVTSDVFGSAHITEENCSTRETGRSDMGFECSSDPSRPMIYNNCSCSCGYFPGAPANSVTDTILPRAQTPLRVLITGAAGQVAYSLFQSLANGEVFGPTQRISLVLLETEANLERLNGVVMELIDSALPLLSEIVPTADIVNAFTDIDVAVLVGAKPRRNGMERKDLLETNVRIFKQQGEALDRYAKKTVKVVVVENPANTNAYICQKYAKRIPPENFSCLTRLDQNRARAQIAKRLKVNVQSVKNVIVWGSHSSTQFPDVTHATVTIGSNEVAVTGAINDDDWLKNDFMTRVQNRGTEVIAARKLSSAMSAAKAIRDHLHDWWHGTEPGRWVSMGVVSDGSYGIGEGLFYSFPVSIKPDRTFTIVHGLVVDNFARTKMAASMAELIRERDAAMACLRDDEIV